MIFTILIWILLFLIYISDRNNKTNRWCVVSGIILSLGTLKEYLYFELYPAFIRQFGSVISMKLATSIYSVMTAILYYLAMPSILIFALHFYAYPVHHPKKFRYILSVNFLPSIIISFIYWPTMTSNYQHNNHFFWYTAALYNLFYGALVTVLMIKAVLAERVPAQRQQKRLVCLVVLPPVWYWYITIFVIHSLGITQLMKIWKNNTFIITIVIIFYISAAFREGIMGMRLRSERYQWDADMQTVSKGAQYTSHILKNEVTKIEWCISNLSKEYEGKTPEEIAIVQRSTDHLKQFVNKTQFYSNDIALNEEDVPVYSIIESSILSVKDYVGENIKFNIDCDEDANIRCDKEHIIEVLNNLVINASDAMEKNGCITIVYTSDHKKHFNIISVSDEGHGISKENMYRLFEPYFTTKKTNSNFGLGLTYCFNVMKKHKGFIDVKSEEGKGTTFYLLFPAKL